MKNYSDLTVTDLKVNIELGSVGNPDFTVDIKSENQHFTPTVNQTYYIDLLTPFTITIELMNKDYNVDNETAVIIQRLSIDNIDIIPKYTHLAVYDNDHGFTDPTNYLGFNGKWTLTIDRPFYQWLHQARSQGWLLG